MPKGKKTFEDIELSSGKTVNITVKVEGFFRDDSHEAIIESHNHETECDDDLDSDDETEIEEKVEDLVYGESWTANDFGLSDDEDFEDEEEDDI